MNALLNRKISLGSKITLLLLAAALILSACAPAAVAVDPAATQALPPTAQPAAPTATKTQPDAPYRLDYGALATGVRSETVPAVPKSDNSPYWEIMPQFTRLTLQGYPVTGHLMRPQIFIYPLKDLAGWNEYAGKEAATLQEMLKNHAADENRKLPFLPIYNAAQVIHVQVKYLDFKNGQGVRYLTQFDQAVLPINNHELIYTYQGLSADGKYYVSAVLPINHPSLPANENPPDTDWQQFDQNFATYLPNMVSTLNQQPASTFTPDLSQLDNLIQSLEIH